MSEEFAAPVRTWRKQGLTATVHRACAKCTAPGVYTNTEYVKTNWAACWVPVGDEQDGQPVGDRCPNCGASRAPGLISQLGEIWRKRFS